MYPKDKKKWLHMEEARLAKYQHQHRGLRFQKVLLPAVSDRKVNLVGRDNHIYRGSVPKVPLDQLPPEVDETSIDEDSLYKEIREMNFPPVPEQEPLGPSRRIGGKYTLAKRMALAPIRVDCTEELEETQILGKDGGIYRGKGKYPSRIELDKKLRGTKRPIQKVLRTSSSRGYVEPSLVLLQTSDKPTLYGKGKETLIKLPTAQIGSIMAMMKEKSIEEEIEIISEASSQKEPAAHEREDFQSETTKASEKSKETQVGDEEMDEQKKEDAKIPVERDSEETVETDTDASAETDADASAETDADASAETDTDASVETYAEGPTEYEDFSNTEEPDTWSPVETNASESIEAEESLYKKKMKETAEESGT